MRSNCIVDSLITIFIVLLGSIGSITEIKRLIHDHFRQHHIKSSNIFLGFFFPLFAPPPTIFINKIPFFKHISCLFNIYCFELYIQVTDIYNSNVMPFLFNLLRIKGLYMFRPLLAHPQETIHKRHLVYCVRVMSVGCYLDWSGTAFNSNPGSSLHFTSK
jgi:hypothetical protein